MLLKQVCITYIVKEVASFRGLGTMERALELHRPPERKLLVAYVETATNSKLFYMKCIPKVLYAPLKGKESR